MVWWIRSEVFRCVIVFIGLFIVDWWKMVLMFINVYLNVFGGDKGYGYVFVDFF